MKKNVLLIVLLLMFQNLFCQSENVEIITHKVALGETMIMISRKYLVDPTDIYRLNKKAIDGISAGMILQIPQPIKSQEIIAERIEQKEKEKIAALERIKQREEQALLDKKQEEIVAQNLSEEENRRRENINKLSFSNKKHFIDHTVKSGETLTSLSKRYGISIEDIEKENKSTLKKGLQVGQNLKILVSDKLFVDDIQENDQVISGISSDYSSVTNGSDSTITHKVLQGETLYSISRNYNIPVEIIQQQNENVLKNGLQTGQELVLKSNNSTITVNKSKPTENNSDFISSNGETLIKHYVEPKETLYSISKKYNITVQEIQEQNQNVLKKGLQTGQEISIRLKK
jgi:LysM repeat protein